MFTTILGTIFGSILGVLGYKYFLFKQLNKNTNAVDSFGLKSVLDSSKSVAEDYISDLEETDNIAAALDRTTGGEWYVQEDKDTWALLATHEDGGDPHKILVIPKSSINSVIPNTFDSNFITESHNSYLSTLFDIVDIVQLEREQMIASIEEGLLNAKHTADDYKKLLNSLLAQLNSINEDEETD